MGLMLLQSPAGGHAIGVVVNDVSFVPPVERHVLTLSGWFHLIWNGGPVFVLIDDAGRAFTLLVTEDLFRPLGGVLTLQGRRVRITGERVSQPQGAIRVHSIELEPEWR